jgi:hypothetical protein
MGGPADLFFDLSFVFARVTITLYSFEFELCEGEGF